MYRMRRDQWQAVTVHQSKKEEDGYEFQEYIFTIATEENCKIFGGGRIKDRVENPNMTEHVRTKSGKTISIDCDRRQNATRIMETVERKTLILKDQLYLANPGTVLSDEKQYDAGATIDMSSRITGGMKKEEPETEEDKKKQVAE